MERSFNTAGPCFDDEHYMLPPERRLGDALGLIARDKCFVFHAVRQTGKTTSLSWLVRHLRTTGHRALVIETARDQPETPSINWPPTWTRAASPKAGSCSSISARIAPGRRSSPSAT